MHNHMELAALAGDPALTM